LDQAIHGHAAHAEFRCDAIDRGIGQTFWVAAQELADGFFAPARLFPGGIVTLGLSRTGPLVTIHDAGPDLCPTLQEANITLSAAIQAGYQL
jgi:hypothetical protein